MQSGYGGVSEMQQFTVDGICSQFFPVPATTADLTQQHHKQQHVQQQPHPFLQQQQQQFHHFHQYPVHHPHHLHFQEHHHNHPSPSTVPQHPPQQQLQLDQPPRFPPHFHHPIPITQQLFQHNHQFHLFQQEQQRRLHHHHLQPLDHDPQPPENTASSPRIDVGAGSNGGGGGISSFLGPSMNFRLSVNENSGNSRDGLNDDNGLLQGDEVDGSEERRWPAQPQSSRQEDDSAAASKEPFWRPLDLDLEYVNRNSKRFKETSSCSSYQEQQQQHQEQEFLVLEGPSTKLFKETKVTPINNVEAEDGTNSSNNYKLFSELEAICKPGTNAVIIGNNNNNNNHQTGSSSALTGENLPTSVADPSPIDEQNADEVMDDHVAQRSDTSTGEEASLKKATTISNLNKRVVSSSTKEKGKRRRRKKQELRSIVAFLETLVKQLMDHQETLHRKFLEALEKRDQERMAMEEAWRQQEATKSMIESKAREERQAIAAAREAEIVSFLESITGESLNLPTKPPKLQEDSNDANINVIDNDENHQTTMSSNRWPKSEVQALIRVRSGLETRFQEPGLKGPLWEEVSSAMAGIGYRRSAKRCKEKWENINKYFRKTKESAKRRPRHSKTCPYFQQLDQLYSKPSTTTTTTTATTNKNSDPNLEQRGNSELLDAIVVSKNEQSGFNNYSDMVVPLRIEFDTSNRGAKGDLNGDGPLDEEGGDEEEDDEGEGDSLASSVKKGQQRDEEDERMEENYNHPSETNALFFGKTHAETRR